MEPNSPIITVLMSVYNGETYLRESIDSILNQTFNDFEFLIINDGSMDATREIILSYDDTRIILVDNEENIGLSKSLNIGIHRSRGDYIARQDADDISHPMRFEKEYILMREEDCDVVYCRYEYMDRRGRQLLWVSPIFSAQNLGKGLISLMNPIAHGSVLMKKFSLIDAGGYNDLMVFSQDYELWLRLLSMKKKIECVDYVGYYQRILPRADKIKRDAQRLYGSMVINYYLNDKEMPTSELANLNEKLLSYRGLKQQYIESIFQQVLYWCNVKKIKLRAFFNNYSIFSHRFNTIKHSGVLMVTGVYYPEVSGAANQCRQLVDTLREKVNFIVLTTTRDPDLPPRSQFDGVEVLRVLLNERSVTDYLKASLRIITFILSRRKDFQIAHLHGFSLKSALVVLLSKIFNKNVIIKMTSVGHDDPEAMKRRSFILNYFFSKADTYVGVSPQFEKTYRQSQLPANRLKQIPNGVDINRFRPVTDGEKAALREMLGLPKNKKFILFVGHFSREKCPDLLLTAWKRYIAETFPETGIIFVGSTNPDHYEVDAELTRDIQQLAQPYINERIFFIERTQEIEKVYQASDMFVLPSLREGMPNSLLEAMACGLPVIASELNGITDWIVKDGINGYLVPSGNKKLLGKVIIRILINEADAHRLGLNGRIKTVERFSIYEVRQRYEKLYNQVLHNYCSLN